MKVVPATALEAVDFLSRPIRQADIDEWVLGTGMTVAKAVFRAVCSPASNPRALLNSEGHCISLWGVSAAPDHSEVGWVWLIASEEAATIGRRIHRLWPREVAWMHSIRPDLRALAYASNKLHLQWLHAVGFERLEDAIVHPALPPYAYFRRLPRVS